MQRDRGEMNADAAEVMDGTSAGSSGSAASTPFH